MKNLLAIIDLHIKRFSWLYTLLGLAIGAGALLYAIWVANHPVKLPQKELTCTLEYAQSMLIKTAEDRGIQVLYNGVEVQNPFISSIIISNTGEYTISNDDFKTPFIISLTDSEQVLNYNINRTTNAFIMKEITNNLKILENMLIIENFMLNPGESFAITIVTDKSPGSVNYGYRLEGISTLNLVNNGSPLVVLRKTPRKLPLEYLIGVPLVSVVIILSICLWLWCFTKKQQKMSEEKILVYLQSKSGITVEEKTTPDGDIDTV